MSTIRDVEDEDVDAVLDYIAAEVWRTDYHRVLPDPLAHADQLMAAARARGVALAAFDDRGRVVGCLIMPMHDYMGSVLAEEVAWFADLRRDLLRLFAQGESQAVQKGATVVRMTAPSWTSLGTFYGRRGYRPLETSYVKVLSDGSSGRGGNRGGSTRGGPRGVLREEEGQETGTRTNDDA